MCLDHTDWNRVFLDMQEYSSDMHNKTFCRYTPHVMGLAYCASLTRPIVSQLQGLGGYTMDLGLVHIGRAWAATRSPSWKKRNDNKRLCWWTSLLHGENRHDLQALNSAVIVTWVMLTFTVLESKTTAPGLKVKYLAQLQVYGAVLVLYNGR